MKRSACPVLYLLAALPAFAVTIPAKSGITAATVYTDRALVTRTATVELTAGTHEIVFENLPGNLASQSLQVSGRGSANATILDATPRQQFLPATPNERIKALEDEIKAGRQQQRTYDDRAAVVNEQRDLLRRMLAAALTPTAPSPAAAPAPARMSLEEWQKLSQYSDESLGKLAAEIQTLDRQREELGARLTALQQQLARLRGAGGQSVTNITVRLTAAAAGNLQLAVTYAVPNASWTPAYDARLRSADRTVELSYHGVVRQNTGEDWTNVTLTLSTARPSLGGAAPEVANWFMDVARPAPSYAANDVVKLSPFEVTSEVDRGFQSESVGSGARMKPALRDAPVARAAQMTVESGVTSATFKVAAPATVPSDNSPQKIAITSVQLPAKLRYQAAPKYLEAAFLTAAVTNASDFPLLAGDLNTFLDDVFIASSSLKTVMPGENFDLALGADDGIAIKRRVVNRFSENTGLTNGKVLVTYEYALTLTNNRRTAERITVREPFPKSRDEHIVIKLVSPLERDLGTADKPKEITREASGALAWDFTLQPGAKRDLTLKFSVEFPADIAVSGLE